MHPPCMSPMKLLNASSKIVIFISSLRAVLVVNGQNAKDHSFMSKDGQPLEMFEFNELSSRKDGQLKSPRKTLRWALLCL